MMKLVENPAKFRPFAIGIFIVTFIVMVVNGLSTLSQGEANKSTTANSLIMKICVAILIGTAVFAIYLGIANKRYRNQSSTSVDPDMQLPQDNSADSRNSQNT